MYRVDIPPAGRLRVGVSGRRLFFLSVLVIVALCGRATSAVAAEVAVGEGGSIEVQSGERRFSVGGRLRLDGAWFDEDTTRLPAGIETNQALVQLQGRVSEEWSFAFAYEFVSEQVFNAYVERSGLGIGHVRVGQFRPQVGLFAGGAWIAFNHRSMVEQALTLPRLVGAGLSGAAGRFSYSASVSGDQIGRDSQGDDPLRLAGRVAMRIGADADTPLQIGASFVYRETDDTRSAGFSANFGAAMEDTPELIDVEQAQSDYFRVVALEGLWMKGPLSLQGEYMRAHVQAPGSPTVDGFHGQIVYFLTGDTRRYSTQDATLGRPVLANPDRGAWEMGVRLESLDLRAVGGGESTAIGIAINHYFSNPLRLSTTITRTDIDNGINGDEEVTSFHLRLQWFL